MMYYTLVFFPIIFLLFEKIIDNKKYIKYLWFLFFFYLILFLGLRNQVGGDWYQYLNNYQIENLVNPLNRLSQGNPNLFDSIFYFFAINEISINFLYFTLTIIFTYFLFKMLGSLKYKWLALLSTIPYLIIVVSIGYIKQATAISFIFFAIYNFNQSNIKNMNISITVASLTHISASIFFLLNIYLFIGRLSKKKIYFLIGFVLIISLFIIIIFLDLFKNYLIYSDNISTGYIYRIILGLPFLFIIMFLKYIGYLDSTVNRKFIYKFYTHFYLLLIFLSIINYLYNDILNSPIKTLPNFLEFIKAYSVRGCFDPNICAKEVIVQFQISTLIDRIHIYFMIIYPLIISDLFKYIHTKFNQNMQILLSTYLIYFLFIFTQLYLWLNFANHSKYWLPYRNILFN